MLYVNYDKFMEDLQRELDITLPEYNRHSGYFDDKNFISCNRKSDDLIFMEIALKHNEDYSKNVVNLKIPFEVINKQVALNYPLHNNQIQDALKKVNDYLPVYHSIAIDNKKLEVYHTSYLLISADLVITKDLYQIPSYLLDEIQFDFEIQYDRSYSRMSVQDIFKKVDEKLMSNLYANPSDYEKISMIDRVRAYNIAQKLLLVAK
jgi:hypothetical protein